MKPRNHVALAMLRAPKRGNLVHQRKAGNHRKDFDMVIDMEDVPCYKVTVDVYVTGYDGARAVHYITQALMKTKQDEECDIFDWDIQDVEQT